MFFSVQSVLGILIPKLFNFYKLACWDFDRECIEFIDQFSGNCHYDNYEPSNQWI